MYSDIEEDWPSGDILLPKCENLLIRLDETVVDQIDYALVTFKAFQGYSRCKFVHDAITYALYSLEQDLNCCM